MTLIITGVRTRDFGPHAWKVIHSLATYFYEMNDIASKDKFWSVIGDVLPCIKCRRSSELFVKELDKNFTCEQQAFQLHEMVNMKLFYQDIQHALSQKESLEPVIRKWAAYQPRKYRVEDTSSQLFFTSCMFFCGYMVLDVEECRSHSIKSVISLLRNVIIKSSDDECVEEKSTIHDGVHDSVNGLLQSYDWNNVKSRLKFIYALFSDISDNSSYLECLPEGEFIPLIISSAVYKS